MAVAHGLEAIPACDLVLQSLDLFVVELYQRPAFRADQMVMMAVFVVVLVETAPVVELKLAGQAALFQQLQSAIDGRESYGGVFGFYERIEVFARYMAFDIEKYIQNQVALRRALQSLALQVFVEYLFLFAFHNCSVQTAKIIHRRAGLAKLCLDYCKHS